MSCTVLSTQHIATIARGIEKIINAPGLNEFKSENLSKVFGDCRTEGWADEEKIYKKLYELNLKAYEERYKEKGDNYIPKPFNYPDILPFPKVSKTTFGIYELTPAHYQFLKLLESYNYQICEDGLKENEVRKELIKVVEKIKKFIINNNEEYDKAKWFI